MADEECGNDCTTRCGSNCCCNSNCRISSAFAEEDERRGRNFTTAQNMTGSSLESNIQMYQRPFSETPDIFKAHIPTSTANSLSYLSYRDSIHEKSSSSLGHPPHHLTFGGECIGSPFGNNHLNLTSTATVTSANCPNIGLSSSTSNSVASNIGNNNNNNNNNNNSNCRLSGGPIVSSIESSPLAMSTVDVASLSTASPSGSSSTNAATSSTLFGGRRNCLEDGHLDGLPHATSGCTTDYATTALLTPLSIFTDVTSDSMNGNDSSNLHNSSSLLPNLYAHHHSQQHHQHHHQHPQSTTSTETALITSSNSSSTALGATEMDIGCVSSFDQKLYHAFTSSSGGGEEDVTWNQFQGSLNSSLGRKYHQQQQQQHQQQQQYQLHHLQTLSSLPSKSPLPSPTSLLTSPGASVTVASEKASASNKLSSASKTFRSSVRRWICPPSRQVFSVTTATHHHHHQQQQQHHHHHHHHQHLHHGTANASSSANSMAYGDESNYQIPNTSGHNGSNGGPKGSGQVVAGTFCSPFKIPQIILKESPTKRSKKCLLIICLFLISSTILITSGGLVFNQFVNKFASRSSSRESASFYSHQRKFWWKDAILYEIFPPSFKDTDADGFGDLKGIISKVPYIKDLGVTGVRLNSIYTALDYPHQFEHVIDFKDVDPKIGTLDDFKLLVKHLHREGLTVILDINPSITSDQHPWATSWLANKSSEYSSFYVINSQNDKPLDVTSTTAIDREGKDLEEIHLSFGGHLYLNWSHPGVRIKMLEVFNFWLNLGVDGFYLKNLHHMQVTSVYMMSEILDDLLEILNLDQVTSDEDAITRDEDESEDEINKKFYSKRQANIPPRLSMNQRPQKLKLENTASPSPHSLHSLHLNNQINNHKSAVVSDELKLGGIKIGPPKPRTLGKRILIASRPSIESLTHRKRLELESKLFKSSTTSANWTANNNNNNSNNNNNNNNNFSESSERNHFHHQFYPSSFSSDPSDTRASTANSLHSIDFFSYFHLIDTFLDIRMNETENIRDQVNEIFLSDLTKSHPWVLWNIGSSSYSRLASRIGSEFVAAASFLLVSLPGSISLLYGDEIGLTNSYHSISNKEFRGGQLVPMSWSTGANSNFSQSNLTTTVPWIPIVVNGVNVERSSESIRRFQHLTTFRRYNFNSNSVEKYGNYLFHYINNGEIVLERYFSKRDTRVPSSSSLQLLQQQQQQQQQGQQLHLVNSNNLPLISTSDAISHSASSSSPSSDTRAKRWVRKNGQQIESNTTSVHLVKKNEDEFISSSAKNFERMHQNNITSGPPDDRETGGVKCNSSSVTSVASTASTSASAWTTVRRKTTATPTTLTTATTSTAHRIIRSPMSANDEPGEVYIRTRFVLFANLARAERVRDFRDKFHSGSIRVTSNPKRMRDFLYLRSLKLDPGEAIIAQVE